MDEQSEFEADDKSGIVTGMIWMEYPKAGGWIPGLVYVIAALAYQILRVYTDLWLSRWTDQSVHTSVDERQDVNKYSILIAFN
jgi:hypothetical protein